MECEKTVIDKFLIGKELRDPNRMMYMCELREFHFQTESYVQNKTINQQYQTRFE